MALEGGLGRGGGGIGSGPGGRGGPGVEGGVAGGGRGGPSGRGSDSGFGGFFERQRQSRINRSRALDAAVRGGGPSDLSGFRPGSNPELGGSLARATQAASIERVHGSSLAAFARGDIMQGFSLGVRNIGGLLGFEEQLNFDPVGGFTTRVGVNFLDTLSLMPAGVGVLQAVAMLNAGFPLSAASMTMNALGQRRTVQKLGSFVNPTIDLGVRMTAPAVRAAQAKVRSGQAITAADQMALDQVAREQQRQTSMRERASSDSTQTPGTIAPRPRPVPVAFAPAPAPRAFRPDRASRLLSGQDPSTGLDLLRTAQQAAVAQGLAPARPRVNVPGRPARAGPLV